MKLVSWTNFVLGTWLIFAPVLLRYTSVRVALYEDMIFGAVIASFALWRAVGEETPSMIRVSWVVAAAGFWVMMAPFTLGYGTTRTPVDNDVIVGLLVFILGIWRTSPRPQILAHR